VLSIGTELNPQSGPLNGFAIHETLPVRPDPLLPTGTLTFLFADIADSIRLWEEFPDDMQASLVRYSQILRETLVEHHGYIFRTAGSTFCAAFSRAGDAIRAALTIQQALQPETARLALAVQVLMALHSGSAEERDGKYFGPTVNRLTRLWEAGHGGQILLSLTTCELVRDHLPEGVQLLDLGYARLKDLSAPEHVFQLVGRGLPETFPPLRCLDQYPTNLPMQPTALVGRGQEVKLACEILRRPQTRLLTLTGPGGTGKTRLGLQIAAELLEDFEHGTFFVGLSSLNDPALVAPTIAQTLGLKDGSNQSAVESLTSYLSERRMLLVLDNFEQLVTNGPLLTELLAAAPGLKMVVTSREVLHLYGEREFSVPPLSLPDLDHLSPLEQLLSCEAIALFVQHATSIKPEFALTETNARIVAEICAALDGLPLAIELAAARIKLLSPEALLTRLTSNLGMRLKLLTGGARDLPARQQTLRSTLDWSYGLLNPEERKLFTFLGIFAGGCSLEAVEAVLGYGTGASSSLLSGDDPLDGLTSLVDKSLLRQGEGVSASELRFTMLQTLHEYAYERLVENGKLSLVRQRHAMYYLELAEQSETELKGADQGRWLERLELEHDNLRAALNWGMEAGSASTEYNQARLEVALRLAGALSRFWEMRGYLNEGREQLTALLEAVPDHNQLPTGALAKVMVSLGRLSYLQGDYATAQHRFDESLALYRQLQDKANILVSLKCLGDLAMRQSNYSLARTLFEESLALSQETEHQWDTANLLNSLGLLGWFQGDFKMAEEYYEQSLDLWQDLRDQRGYATVLSNKGAVAHQQGDYASSEVYNRQSLVLWRGLGDRWGVAHALQHLGLAAYAQEKFEVAQQLQVESLELRRKLGDRWGIGRSLANLGLVAYRLNELATARAYFQESLSLRRSLEDKWGIADALVGLGQIACCEGDFSAGALSYQEGLPLAYKYNLRLQIARLLEGMAVLLSLQRQLAQAAQLWGAAATLRDSMGSVIPPCERGEYEEAIAAARARMGLARFETAWETGQTMPLEQVIEQAMAYKVPETPPLAAVAEEPPPEKPKGVYPGGLTAREVEVLRLVAQGLTNAQVAEKLIMAPRTVNVHLTSIYSKLEVTSRTAAARFAMEQKLL
jgi:predicted ATPase/class 3 adenylate cyclase/DNA-binding CsgD family transcriptional regulator/Tfp pilus assembly protein PilF